MKEKHSRWDSPCDTFQSPVHLPEGWLGVEPRRPNWREDLVCEKCGWPKSAHDEREIARNKVTRAEHRAHGA